METYIFHAGELPEGVVTDYETVLFNLPAFAVSQGALPCITFFLIDEKRKKAVAGIQFRLAGDEARSPLRAPFGSVDCADHLHPRLVYRFLEGVEAHLKDTGTKGIHVKNPPRAYAENRLALIETFFLNRKYKVTDAEVSAVIRVNGNSFAEGIRRSEQLRLRQARQRPLTFHHAGVDQLEVVYDFIARCHREKGYTVSIGREDLQRTVKVFPDRYLLFIVRDQQEVVAASICIRVSKRILYNFLTNHEQEYNHVSPPLLLMEGIYQYCQANGFHLFDLGTSALRGEPNFPLLDFKMHIGGVPSSKFTFYKKVG